MQPRLIFIWTVPALAAAAVTLAALPALADQRDPACSFNCVHDRIQHRFRIEGHPIFHPEQLLQERCAFVEFPPPTFRVAADGSQASIFDVTQETFGTCGSDFVNPNLLFVDEQAKPVLNPDPDVYGVLVPVDSRSDYVRVQYTHPRNPPASGELFRSIPLGVFYFNRNDPGAGLQLSTVLFIHVYRPPVVMMHGLWSSARAFARMEAGFASHYEPFQLYRVDYSITNDSAFLVNSPRVADGIDAVIQQSADADLAAGRTDLVGHSMGGILSRLYVQGQDYANEVRRIVTCNTPHSGSQMANLLLDRSFDRQGLICSLMSKAMSNANNPVAGCYNGAVHDLNVYSLAINNLLNTAGVHPREIGVHALVTVFEPPNVPLVLPGPFGLLYNVLRVCGTALLPAVFNSPDHDLIVAASSQSGGLEASTTSLYPGIAHAGSVAEAAVIDRVKALLSEPPTSTSFTGAGYAPDRESYFTPSYCAVSLAARSARAVAAVAPTITITSPAPGTRVAAGGSLVVDVSGAAEIATILLVMSQPPDRVVVREQPGPEARFDVTVPDDALGPQNLVAAGLDATGLPAAVSETVAVEVTAPAALESIAVYPPAVYLRRCRPAGLQITGRFADGVARDLSFHPALDFSFAIGHAARYRQTGVILHEALDDSLTITLDGVESAAVPIRALSVDGDDGAPCPDDFTTTSTTSTTITTIPVSTTTTAAPSTTLAPSTTTTLPSCEAGCDDGDACTDDVCDAGSCTHIDLTGVPGVACRLAGLISVPLCPPDALDPRYEALVAQRLSRALELVRQAQQPATPKRWKRLLARAARLLAKSRRGKPRGTTPACRASIAERVDAVRQMLAAVLP